MHFSDEVTDLCRRGIISCSVTTSFLVYSCATSDMSVFFLYVMQNIELFTSRGCLSFRLFFFKYPSVGMSLSFFPSVCRDEGLKLSLPCLPPLFSTFLPFQLQHEKMGHEERKKWQRKSEMRSNLILIWFLLGSCFNPLWAGFPACMTVDWWLILVSLTIQPAEISTSLTSWYKI